MNEWYTVKEFAKLKGYKLKSETRRLLATKAVKLEDEGKFKFEKIWKKENGMNNKRYRKTGKGVRVWPDFILNKIFFEG